MPRAARLRLLALTVVAALALGGCGNKEQEGETIVAETEGIYVNVDGLSYQVQISRILNPADLEDAGFLRGISEGVAPANDEVWFAIFMRVQNESKSETFRTADTFEMEDTTGARYEPLNLDEQSNVFAYEPGPLRPGGVVPALTSPSWDNSIQGSLLLYKVKVESLYNRPVELHIANSASGGQAATVDLDI